MTEADKGRCGPVLLGTAAWAGSAAIFGENNPDIARTLLGFLALVLFAFGLMFTASGWSAFWDAIEELNIQAAERKARDQGEA